MTPQDQAKERERIAAGLRAMSRPADYLICNDGTDGGASICGVPILYCHMASHPSQMSTSRELHYFPVWAVPGRDDLVDAARFAAAYDEWF